IWNPTIADAFGKRFVVPDRPNVAISWRVMRSKLDDTTSQWAAQWNGACHADRTADALLYGQRLACLDTAFLEIRAWIDGLPALKPETFTFDGDLDVGIGGRTLEDCASTAVLRKQVPAPPLAIRERVAGLLIEANRT